MHSNIRSEVIKALKYVNKCLKVEAKYISRYIKDKEELPESSLFKFYSCLPINSSENQFEFQDGKTYPGVYVFQITELVTIDSTKGNFNSTISKAARLKAQYLNRTYFDVNDILYLGKDETDVAARINQHISPGNNITTSSLRLNDPNRRHLYGKLQVYAFVLKGAYKDYAKTIVSNVERHLHDQLAPLAGTRR